MNRDALNSIKDKRKKWNKFLNCKNEMNKNNYQESKIKATKDAKKAKVEYEKRLAENINTNNKAFWNYVQSKTKTRETIGNLIDNNGNLQTENKSKCEILNKFFGSVFTKENIDILPEFEHKLVNIPLGEIIINAQLVEKYIKMLKPSKSQGPGNCHPKFLQETIDEVTEPLAILFNKSLTEGKIPEQWRLAYVVPLHKKDQKVVQKITGQ